MLTCSCNLRAHARQALPFRTVLSFEEGGGIGRIDVIVRLDCEFPSDSTGTTATVKVPLPKFTTSCAYELGASGQTLKYVVSQG